METPVAFAAGVFFFKLHPNVPNISFLRKMTKATPEKIFFASYLSKEEFGRNLQNFMENSIIRAKKVTTKFN